MTCNNQQTRSPLDSPSQATTAASAVTLKSEPAPADALELTKDFTVTSGDTLSVLFAKAELGNSLMHKILDTNKDAKRFANLKVGQTVSFKLDENQELQSISSPH